MCVSLLCVCEEVLFEVLFAHEEPVAVVTLQVARAGVYDHVRRHVGLLGKRLLTQTAAEVLLA